MTAPSLIASWIDLRFAFGSLQPEGTEGFEGLLAQLFEAEIGQRFYLARKGDQPAGDAYAPASGIVIQAKRYKQGTVSENEIEGDISRAMREIPDLSLFVVAVTKPQNQLKLRLEKKTRETGFDIILFALEDGPSELGALAVAHWHIVRHFFPGIEVTSDEWAHDQNSNAAVKAKLAHARYELSGLATRKLLGSHAVDAFRKRWDENSTSPTPHNHVALGEAVQRPQYREILRNWWEHEGTGFKVLEGEEGTGKTWIAADFVESLSQRDGEIALWLDSLAWAEARTVESTISIALAATFPPSDERASRLKKNILRRWKKPILIVLDGANEREAWIAAECLLQDYRLHSTELSQRVRLLFTSRPLENRCGAGLNFWGDKSLVSVKPFDEDEFKHALERYFPDLDSSQLNQRLRGLATIPRYFRLCIGLRERLSSLSHLTKEILLWADLENKIHHRDPQWRSMEGHIGANASQFLAFLAEKLGWPADDSPTFATSEICRHLPNFLNLRGDLLEQRIVIDSNLSKTQISSDHLILGWALALRSFVEAHAREDEETLGDRLHKFLEPAASNDAKARAVHVAALLVFLDSNGEPIQSKKTRMVLIRLWALHHNAVIQVEDLEFFIKGDFAAYIDMVESLFQKYLPGCLETTIIQPLAITWRDGNVNAEALREVLERWLRLIFPGDARGSESGTEPPPSKFSPAKTVEQLRLSYAAISIISFRPELQLLPALADCYRSADFCYKTVDQLQGKPRFPIKSSVDPLGVLARWHYGKAGLREIGLMAEQMDLNSEEWNSLRWFARQWRMAELPNNLGANKDIFEHTPKDLRESFESLQTYLRGEMSPQLHFVGLEHLGLIAIRSDFPLLAPEEIDALISDAQSRLAKIPTYRTISGTLEERAFDDLLPWLARYSPLTFGTVVRELWLCAIRSNETFPRLMSLDELMPADYPDKLIVEEVLRQTPHLLTQKQSDFGAITLSQLMLLHGTPKQLLTWFKSIELCGFQGIPIPGFLPLPTAFKYFVPSGFVELAKVEAFASLKALTCSVTNDLDKTRARYWLQIVAYVCEVTEELAEWALRVAKQYGKDSEILYPLFTLVMGSKSPSILRRTLAEPCFREFQLGYNAWRWGVNIPPVEYPTFTFSELQSGISLTVSGWLLYRAKRDEELCAWGHVLAKRAFDAIATSPTQLPRQNLKIRVDPEGRNLGWGYENLPGGTETQHFTSSAAWGVDRNVKRSTPTDEEYQEALDDFHTDIERRRKSERAEFLGFNAAAPLIRWSQVDPKEFAQFAEEYLFRVRRSTTGITLDLSFFTTCVAIALFRLKPELALQLSEWTTHHMRVQILIFEGALSWSTATLWDKNFNENVAIAKMRRTFLLNARNDEELLWHSLAAEKSENEKVIESLALEWVSSELESDRALAVSIFAFMGDAIALAELSRLRERDPSFWIRNHAAWGWDVCMLEIACKDLYRKVLAFESLPAVAAGLEQIRPALSPKAHSWRKRIERDFSNSFTNKRKQGYIKLFWHHWGGTSSQHVEVVHRKLKEYCRGEKLSDGITNRMAPWWDID